MVLGQNRRAVRILTTALMETCAPGAEQIWILSRSDFYGCTRRRP